MPQQENSVSNEQIMNFMKNKFEMFEAANDKWYKKVDSLNASHIKLVKDVGCIKVSQAQVQNDVKDLEVAVSRLEQLQLCSNMLVNGVPEAENESAKDLKEIMAEIVKAVDENIKYKFSTHRLGRKVNDRHRPILVKFNSSMEMSTFLKAKKKKVLSCDQVVVNGISIGGRNDVIYCSEQLVPFISRLFFVARKLVKKKVLERAWVRGGKVFVVKLDNESPVYICHESQFASCMGMVPTKVVSKDQEEQMMSGDEHAEGGSTTHVFDANESMVIVEECINSAKKSSRTRVQAPRVTKKKTKPSTASTK